MFLKGKVKTYALVVSVMAIWAVIGFQILAAFKSPNEVEISHSKANSQAFIELKERQQFSIKNNYRDPFSGKLPLKKKIVQGSKKAKPKVASPPFPEIRYNGMVSNGEGKIRIFSLMIDGSEVLLKEGSEYQEIQLLKGDANQIALQFKSTRKTFTR